MQQEHDTYGSSNGHIVTWAMFEGLIAVIEAWIYREMPREGWECVCDRGTRIQESTCALCGTNLGSSSSDVLHVYHVLKQVTDLIDDRKWDAPMYCSVEEEPPLLPPFTQANQYNVQSGGMIATNDISQRFYWVYIRKTGGSTTSADNYLTSNGVWRNEARDTGISAITFFDKHIENDIRVDFKNTAGPVYMQSVFLSRPYSGKPSIAMQSFCASLISGPLDGSIASIEPGYTASRPSNYKCWVGFVTKGTAISNFINSAASFTLNVMSLSGSFAVTWECQLLKSNSTTPGILVSTFPVQVGGQNQLFSLQLLSNIVNFNYSLRFNAYNALGVFVGTTPEYNITSYMGTALYASRTSNKIGISPAQGTVSSSEIQANLSIQSQYISYNLSQPIDDVASENFFVIKAKVLLVNPQDPQMQKSISIWWNFDYVTGYFPFVIDTNIDVGYTDLYFRTGGFLETGTRFSASYLMEKFISTNVLVFNVSGNQLGVSTIQHEFTSQSTIGAGNSLAQMLFSATQSPNTWFGTPATLFSIPTTGFGYGSSLTVQLEAYYDTQTPPIPPTESELQSVVPIQETAVDEAQSILQRQERILESKQLFTPLDYQFQEYLKKDNPTPQQQSMQYTYFNPKQIETFERAKEEAWQFAKTDGKGWHEAPISQFFNLINDYDHAYFKAQYPNLWQDIDVQKKEMSFAQMAKELYPDAQTLLDLYQEPTSLKRAPYYHTIPKNQKYTEGSGSFSGMIGDMVGLVLNHKSDVHMAQEQIEADRYASQNDPIFFQQNFPNTDRKALSYFSFGTPYTVWNETQGLMKESLMNPYNLDLYDPERKKLGSETYAVLMAKEWLHSQLTPQQLALVAANYAIGKKVYGQKHLSYTNPKDAKKFVDALLKDTIYNVSPFIAEASYLTKAWAEASAQQIIFEKVYNAISNFDLNSIVSKFTKKPEIPRYFKQYDSPIIVYEGMPWDRYKKRYQQTIKDLYNQNPNYTKPELYEALWRRAHQIYQALDDPNIGQQAVNQKLKQSQLDDMSQFYSEYDKSIDELPYFADANIIDTVAYMFKHARYRKNMMEKLPQYIRNDLPDQILSAYNDISAQTKQDKTDLYNALGDTIIPIAKNNPIANHVVPFLHSEPVVEAVKGTFGYILDNGKSLGSAAYQLGWNLGAQTATGVYDLAKGGVSTIIPWGFNNLVDHLKNTGKHYAGILQMGQFYDNPHYLWRGYKAASPYLEQAYNVTTQLMQDARDSSKQKVVLLSKNSLQHIVDIIQHGISYDNPHYLWRAAKIAGPALFQAIVAANNAEKYVQSYIRGTIKDTYNNAYISMKQDERREKDFEIWARDVEKWEEMNKKREAKAQEKAQEKTQKGSNYTQYAIPASVGLGVLGGIFAGYTAYTRYYGDSANNTSFNATQSRLNETRIPLNETRVPPPAPRVPPPAPRVPPPAPRVPPPAPPQAPAGAPMPPPQAPASAPMPPPMPPILQDQHQYVQEQKQQEAQIAQNVVNEAIKATITSQADLQALLDDNNTVDTDDRYMNIHAVSHLVESLDRNMIQTPQIQHFLKIGLGNMFRQQAVRQFLRRNMMGFQHFQILKAIINPEKPYEWKLQQAFFNFFLTKPLYDAKNVIAKRTSEPLVEGLKEIMESPGPVFDFVERISAKITQNHQSFNGAMYTTSPRRVYNLPNNTKMRPLLNEIQYRPIKKLKKL